MKQHLGKEIESVVIYYSGVNKGFYVKSSMEFMIPKELYCEIQVDY